MTEIGKLSFTSNFIEWEAECSSYEAAKILKELWINKELEEIKEDEDGE